MWPGETRLDIPVDRVLDAARAADLEGVVVMGYTKDGGVEYIASSYASGSKVSWLMDRCKWLLLCEYGRDE